MASAAKRFKSEDESEFDGGHTVKYIKLNPAYEITTREYPEISISNCEQFKRIIPPDHPTNKYEFFARILLINTRVTLANIDNESLKSQLLTFFMHLYFTVHHYKEESIIHLTEICNIINAKLKDNTKIIRDEDLLFELNGTSGDEDKFEQVYNLVRAIMKKMETLHFPDHVVFRSLGEVFMLNKEYVAKKIIFDTIIAQFEMKEITKKGAVNNKSSTTFKIPFMIESTRDSAWSDTFKGELNKFLIYDDGGESKEIRDLLWRDVDFSTVQSGTDNYNVHPITPATNYSYQYTLLNSLVIYERTSPTDKFNMKGYMSTRGIVFSYDQKLKEDYLSFCKQTSNLQ